jgi:hypothetical protein
MSNVLVVTLLGLLLNLWANDGSSGHGNWPEWVIRRIVPLICTSALVMIVALWRHDSVVGRAALRASIMTLLASLLNVIPFVFVDAVDYVNARPGRVHTNPAVFEASSSPSGMFGFFELAGHRSRAAQEKEQAEYQAALNACMEEKTRDRPKAPPQPGTSVRFECVSSASQMGFQTFVARYSGRKKA